MTRPAESNEMDVADVLNAAADWIRVHGLHKGWLWPHEADDTDPFPCCALGAIGLASGNHVAPGIESATRVLEWSLRCEAPRWNDAPERTADEVIDALQEAAVRWREGER